MFMSNTYLYIWDVPFWYFYSVGYLDYFYFMVIQNHAVDFVDVFGMYTVFIVLGVLMAYIEFNKPLMHWPRAWIILLKSLFGISNIFSSEDSVSLAHICWYTRDTYTWSLECIEVWGTETQSHISILYTTSFLQQAF